MIRDRNQTNLFSTNFPGRKVAAITVAQEIRNLKFNTKEISGTVERNKSHPSPEGTHQGYCKSGLAHPVQKGHTPRLLQIGISTPSPEGTHQGYCKSGLSHPVRA